MAEIVQVTKFKSLDGCVYDSEKQALAADARWNRENTVDLVKEIKLLSYQGKRYIDREKQKYDKNPSDYSLLLVKNEKHGTYYYLATTPEAIGKICVNIIKDNNTWKYYDTVRDKKIAEEIINTENIFAAIEFIRERKDYQYEGVDFEDVKKFS
jgi:hypothetical protein